MTENNLEQISYYLYDLSLKSKNKNDIFIIRDIISEIYTTMHFFYNISIKNIYNLHNKEQLLLNEYNCENIIINFKKSNYDIDFLMKFIKEITFVINVDIYHSEKHGLIIHNFNYDTISKSISRKLKISSLI
jgi:hypothetical protein